jgi:RIO-like serine/threonine protein kinase
MEDGARPANRQDRRTEVVLPVSRPGTVLKADVFGTITRIGDTVVRDTAGARWWAWPIARHLLNRERRALLRMAEHPGIPPLLASSRGQLARGWIEATPMHLAKPRDAAYFRAAARLLRQLHTARIVHNDLAKETNWLVTPDGRPALVDFQLAMTLDRRRGALARALGHDDLRHLLKHKRSYLPQLLTAREKRILARPSWFARGWMATGKRAYRFITRRILHWQDRDGGGDRSARPPR